MRYYCNICKRDITKAEFLYSIDKFDRPLCREHQDLERSNREKLFRSEQKEAQMIEQEPVKTEPEESGDHTSKSGWKSIGKVVLKMGKGVVKGVKKMVSSSKKRSQIRKWKGAILRRMKMSQLKQLCFESKISTKKTVLEEDKRSEELYWKEYECSKADLVVRLRNKVLLDSIISFANRNYMG